jgi:hypothetical protein
MAIIQSYPTGTPKNGDYLIGTSMPEETGDEAVTKNFAISDVSSLVNKGYKDYVFSFIQNSTNAPVVTELNNDTGLTFTFTRNSPGVFYLVPSSDINISKVWVQVTGGKIVGPSVLILKSYGSNQYDIININSSTGNPVDEVDAGFVELRIYN